MHPVLPLQGAPGNGAMAAQHTAVSDLMATIAVPGLEQPLRFLQITDSHVDLGLDDGPLTPQDFQQLERTITEGGAVGEAAAAQVAHHPFFARPAPQGNRTLPELPSACAFTPPHGGRCP